MSERTTAASGRLAGYAALLLAVLLAGACSSSAHSTAAASSSASSVATTTASTCEQVGAVLSDGPDPDADPVGYAEAQILPLRAIDPPDQALRSAISQLADAYQKFYASNGKNSDAKEAVSVASSKVNSICPGAAS